MRGELLQSIVAASARSGRLGGRVRNQAAHWNHRGSDGHWRYDYLAATDGVGQTLVKVMIPVALSVLSLATLCSMPLAYAADTGGVSPSEINRYQVQQELELEREQASRAQLSAPKSVEETRAEQRRFEAERFRQRQLLDRQHRWVAGEGAKSRLLPHRGSPRGIILQQLQREQASERLSRKLAR